MLFGGRLERALRHAELFGGFADGEEARHLSVLFTENARLLLHAPSHNFQYPLEVEADADYGPVMTRLELWRMVFGRADERPIGIAQERKIRSCVVPVLDLPEIKRKLATKCLNHTPRIGRGQLLAEPVRLAPASCQMCINVEPGNVSLVEDARDTRRGHWGVGILTGGYVFIEALVINACDPTRRFGSKFVVHPLAQLPTSYCH